MNDATLVQLVVALAASLLLLFGSAPWLIASSTHQLNLYSADFSYSLNDPKARPCVATTRTIDINTLASGSSEPQWHLVTLNTSLLISLSSSKVAGTHSGPWKSTEYGGCIVKPQSKKECERLFYEMMSGNIPWDHTSASKDRYRLMNMYNSFTPHYIGTATREGGCPMDWCIVEEDVTHDFLLPSILDYRMSERGACCNLKGFKVMLPSQSPNSSLSLTLSHSDIKEHERDYSYSRIRACLALFLSNAEGELQTELIISLRNQLLKLMAILYSQKSYVFHDSSVLLVYGYSKSQKRVVAQLYVIDFDFWNLSRKNSDMAMDSTAYKWFKATRASLATLKKIFDFLAHPPDYVTSSYLHKHCPDATLH